MSELVEHVQDNLCSRKPSATEPSVIRFCGAGYSDGSFDNSQEMHSLLLCPAQWTALLESPISLVRHKSECRSEEGRSDTFKGDDGVSSENSYEDVPKTERSAILSPIDANVVSLCIGTCVNGVQQFLTFCFYRSLSNYIL